SRQPSTRCCPCGLRGELSPACAGHIRERLPRSTPSSAAVQVSKAGADHKGVPAPLEQRMPHPQFKWIGTASDTSGHADELRGFLRAQEQAGHEPALQELRWTDKEAGLSEIEKEMLRRQSSRSNRHIDVAVHTYLPWDQNP